MISKCSLAFLHKGKTLATQHECILSLHLMALLIGLGFQNNDPKLEYLEGREYLLCYMGLNWKSISTLKNSIILWLGVSDMMSHFSSVLLFKGCMTLGNISNFSVFCLICKTRIIVYILQVCHQKIYAGRKNWDALNVQ